MWTNAKRPIRHILAAVAATAASALLCAGGFFLLDAVYPFPETKVAAVLARTQAAETDRDNGPENWRMDDDQVWRLPIALDAVSPT